MIKVERIVSSLLSLILIILSLSILLPFLLMHNGVSYDSGLNECLLILGDAVENGESIALVSKSVDRAVLLVNDTYKIEILVNEGELICIEEAFLT